MPCHTTIKVFIQRFVPFLGLSFLLSSHLPAQNLSIVSGNGQIAFNSLFTQNVRMVVQAKDANGAKELVNRREPHAGKKN